MSFERDGYEIWPLGEGARTWLCSGLVELKEFLGKLSAYADDDIHRHAGAAELVAHIPRRIIECELERFRALIGADLHIQRKPFLRISRPGVPDDNIGLHRDTWYGDTPHEISVWIPFTDTDENSALRVAPGSHLWPEAAYPVERFAGGVEKGSVKHSLGFIHGQPKRLASPVATRALPVKVGELIVFSLSLLHGVEVNRAARTRVSMDVRLANSLAPVKFARSRDEHYYEQLCVSPVTRAAKHYYEAQK